MSTRIVRTGLIVTLAGVAAMACTVAPQNPPDDQALQRSIETYQRALIARGVTGGNVAGMFRGEQTLAYSIVNSGLEGDTAIAADTVFPVFSMSKPITIVAMMILHERGRYQPDDPVSKYLPEFAKLRCKGEGGATYPCKNELRVVHLLTHQSGQEYYREMKTVAALSRPTLVVTHGARLHDGQAQLARAFHRGSSRSTRSSSMTGWAAARLPSPAGTSTIRRPAPAGGSRASMCRKS